MRKILKINNIKDLNKFYRRIFLYRSVLLKRVFFEITEDAYGITTIVNALNIKTRKERIAYIYDEACKMVDVSINYKDSCDFKNNKCCLHRKINIEKENGCCGNCKYQTIEGCTANNLICKLFFCSEVKIKCDIIKFSDLKILKCLSIRQRLILKSEYFSKREDILNDLYIGSLFMATIRIGFRFLSNNVFSKKNSGNLFQ